MSSYALDPTLPHRLPPPRRLIERRAGRPRPVFRPEQGAVRVFDFKVLKSEHFDIYFYPDEREAANAAARMGERWYPALPLFGHQLKGRQPLILYASSAQFRQTNAIQGDLGEGTGGVTEALRRRIVLPAGGTLGDLDHVIGHELTHAFQYDITGQRAGGMPAAAALPLWFIEGMAEYALARAGRPADRDVDARRDRRTPRATPCPRSGSSTIRGTSPTATGRRCWPNRRALR